MEAEGRSGWGWLTQGRLALLIIFLVLVIDRWIKIQSRPTCICTRVFV